MRCGFVCAGVLALCVGGAALAQSAHEPVTWYAIVDGSGAMLGHASREVERRGAGRALIETQEIYLREQGGQPRRTRTRSVVTEDAAGRVTSVVETARSAHFQSSSEAHVVGGRVRVLRQTPSGVWAEEIGVPADVRFDGGDALVRTWEPSATPVLRFESFNVDAAAVERVELEAVSPRDAEGRFVAVQRRYEGDALRGVARLVIDRSGRIVEAAQPMFGATIRVVATDRESATRRHAPFPVVPSASMPSPYRISAAARAGHMRYRFGFRDGLTFTPPETGEQRVALTGGEALVDVCASCGPGLATDAETLADARRATAWMQADHPRLREIAEPIARMNISDARKMELLLDRARPFIETFDYNGHYSALDTIIRRAGDCTEAAVLLAALGRAAGIPTKVASGLSYSRASYHGVTNAFLAHSWTLAYVDGEWRSFDLALLEFDATHIALTIGDGDPRSIAAAGQLASLLRFDSLAEVRQRVAG